MNQYTFKYISDKINTAQSGKIPRVLPCETVTIKFIRGDQIEYEPRKDILLHYSLKTTFNLLL